MIHKKRIIAVVLFMAYLAIVSYLCFGKPDDLPQLPMNWFGLPADKIGHFLMFAPFTPLAYMSLVSDDMSSARNVMLIIIVIIAGTGLALGTELVQAHLQYRTAEKYDLLADMIGLSTGAFMTTLYIFFKKHQ